MEQNKKFRLRLNLFDGIVLVLALIVGGVLAFHYLTPEEVTVSVVQTKTATYTIRLRNTVPEIVDQIQPGDQLEDAVKNLDLGTVVSVSATPSPTVVLDESTLTYLEQVHPYYMDVDIVVTCPATVTEDQILLTSSYRIRGDETIYVRGPGYLGSGIVLSIDRGVAE